MIDPRDMTKYGLDIPRLEETILFCASVAGKNAMTTALALDRFLDLGHKQVYRRHSSYSPFQMIEYLSAKLGDTLPDMIRSCGLGCYNQRARTFLALARSGIDLKTCGTEELERIPGIGMKTSRFFLLHTRPDIEVAIIDTHVLKFLRSKGYPIPEKVNISAKRYAQYEQWFLDTWRAESTDTLAAYDLMIWNWYAGHSKELAV